MFATVLDRFPTPPCAGLLGLDIIDAKPHDGWVRIRFEAKPEFCNAAGDIQGGMLAAMLDDTMGPAVLITTNAEMLPTTIDMHVSFLAPAKPGPLIGEAMVVQLGKTVGFVEARLADELGLIVARATASVRLIPPEKAMARQAEGAAVA